MDKKTTKTALLILGMHRSGTSCLSGVLSLLGCTPPDHLLAPNNANAKGYWESVNINRFNDEILAGLKLNWREIHPIKFDIKHTKESRATLIKKAANLLAQEFPNSQIPLVKDPRISLFPQLWHSAAKEIGYTPHFVVALRNPLEIACSLEKRNGLGISYGLLLTLRYWLELEFATRELARTFIHFENLLSDWKATVSQLEVRCNIQWPISPESAKGGVSEFLSPELKHFSNLDLDVNSDPRVTQWLRTTYSILNKWCIEGEAQKDYKQLDRIRTEFDMVTVSLGSALLADDDAFRGKIKALSKRVTELKLSDDLISSKLESEKFAYQVLEDVSESRSKELEAMSKELSTAVAENKSLQKQQSELNRLLDSMNSNFALSLEAQKFSQQSLVAERAGYLQLLEEQKKHQDQIFEERQKNGLLAVKLTQMESLLAESRSECTRLVEVNQKNENLLSARQQEHFLQCQHLESALADIRFQLAGAIEDKAEAVLRSDVLQNELANARIQLEQCELELASTIKEKEEVAQTSGNRKAMLADAEKMLEKVSLELSSAKEGLASRIAENLRIAKDGNELKHRYKKVCARFSEQKSQYKFLRAKFERTVDALETSNIRLAELDCLNSSSWFNKIFQKHKSNQPAALPSKLNLYGYLKRRRMLDRVSKTLTESGQFDGPWYIAQYADVASAKMDPVIHYILHGAHEGRNPSADFCSNLYLAANPDVAKAGVNPLYHYIVYGAEEGREVEPRRVLSRNQTISFPEVPITKNVGAILRYISEEPCSAVIPHKPVVKSKQLIEEDGFVSTVKGNESSDLQDLIAPDFIESARYLFSAFLALSGAKNSMNSIAKQLGFGPLSFTDSFHAEGSCVNSSEMLTTFFKKRLIFDDLFMVSDRSLRIRYRILKGQLSRFFRIRVYQVDPISRNLLAPCLGELHSSEDFSIIDLRMRNPYLPLVFVCLNEHDALVDLGLLPFPSLARSGVHHGELIVRSDFNHDKSYINSLLYYSAELLDGMPCSIGSDEFPLDLLLKSHSFTGGERIFSRSALQWLSTVLKIQISLEFGLEGKDSQASIYLGQILQSYVSRSTEVEASRTVTLSIIDDSIPTLGAIFLACNKVTIGDDIVIGGQLCVDSSTQLASYSIMPGFAKLPDVSNRLFESGLPSCGVNPTEHKVKNYSFSSVLLAVKFLPSSITTEPWLIYPSFPEGTGGGDVEKSSTGINVSVVLSPQQDVALTCSLLASLHYQIEVNITSILVPLESEAFFTDLPKPLNAMSSKVCFFSKDDELTKRIIIGNSDVVVNLGRVVLHDPRTLSVLCDTAVLNNVHSVSCAQITKSTIGHQFKQAAPNVNHLIDNVEIDLLRLLPNAIFPVALASDVISVSRIDVWLEKFGLGDDLRQPITDAKKHLHLFTTSVTVTTFGSCEHDISAAYDSGTGIVIRSLVG